MSASTRRRNVFTGESEAAFLISWLNGDRSDYKKETRKRKAIGQLILDMTRSGDLYLKNSGSESLALQVDRELLRYPLRVKTLHPVLVERHKNSTEFKWMFAWQSPQGAHVALSIFAIVQLGERGSLGRVRRCSRCQRWFYAKFNHQRFCQKICQISEYQSGEQWKRKRRERYHDMKNSARTKYGTRKTR